MGYDVYQSSLAIRAGDLEKLRPCLEKIVPMLQQSQIDYFNDPAALNVRLDEIVKELDSFWTSSIPGHDNATVAMREIGLVTDSGGDDSYHGDFDLDRTQAFIEKMLPIYEAQGLDSFDPDMVPGDMVTNEFLDPSISLGF